MARILRKNFDDRCTTSVLSNSNPRFFTTFYWEFPHAFPENWWIQLFWRTSFEVRLEEAKSIKNSRNSSR